MDWLESTTSAVRVDCCQQARQEASIPIAQKQRVAGAGQVHQLRATAAPEPGPKAQVFEPSIGAGNGIEIDGSDS